MSTDVTTIGPVGAAPRSVALAGSLQRDAAAANELARFVKEQGLSQTIQGKEHFTAEAWSAAGRLLGLRVALDDPKPFVGMDNQRGYSCRARLFDSTGVQIAEASSICLRGEKRWSNAEEFALYSMAQTRASGKVHRVALSALAKLAGFEATPAEEMPGDTAQVDPALPLSGEAMPRQKATQAEKRRVGEALTAAGLVAAEGATILREKFQCAKRDDLFSDQIENVVNAILAKGEENAAGLDDIQDVLDASVDETIAELVADGDVEVMP